MSDQNTEKVVKSVRELALWVQWPSLSLSLAFFFSSYLLYFSFLRRKKGGRTLKEVFFPTLGAFRRSRGFCLGTKRGLGGFVRVLFVEVELSKSGCFPSLWWKQSVVFGKLLALCTSSVSVVEDFFSQGFFQPIQLAGVNSTAMCTRFVPPSPSSSPHWIEWVDTAWQWNNIIKNTWAHE